MKNRMPFRLLCASLLFSGLGVAAAQNVEEEAELALLYGDNSFVSIATGSQQSISRAPAVASVITAEDIQAMGATDLDQVLESVPGLHVSFSGLYNSPIYAFRGIHTKYNPQALMLVNGIRINNVFLGNRGVAWAGLPLENVARIEVIRGPGSALYGADAFAGVINVITKTAADIEGTQYGVRAGSFDQRDAWLLHGTRWGKVDAALYLGAGRTDGPNRTVTADAQTALDPSVSMAPGPQNVMRRTIDASMDLAYELWRLRASFQNRETGAGTGLADALDPNARIKGRRWYADLTYANPSFAENWDVTAQLSFFDVQDLPADPTTMLYPPGAMGGAFPDGVIGNPGHYERHTQFSLSGFYTGFKKHRIRLGTGLRIEDMYKTVEKKNYNIVYVPGTGFQFVPLGRVMDVSNTDAVFLKPHKRDLAYVFFQDEWSVAKDWTLTAGVRHDRYSDFGGTTNPRLALVWDAAYNFSIKALHGRAFRAPAFAEQYNMNNPVALGNPNLRPETIATTELAFSWQPLLSLQTNLTLFKYRMKDMIRFVASADPSAGATAQNAGRQTGRGYELEAAWTPTRNLRLSGHLSVQCSIDEATDKDAGLAPGKRVYAKADWRFAPFWQLGTAVNHVADRKREPGDARSPVADYTTVDLTLRREKFAGNWEVRATVLNLFDRDAREPSLAPGNIPFDLPLSGRAFYIQFQHDL